MSISDFFEGLLTSIPIILAILIGVHLIWELYDEVRKFKEDALSKNENKIVGLSRTKELEKQPCPRKNSDEEKLSPIGITDEEISPGFVNRVKNVFEPKEKLKTDKKFLLNKENQKSNKNSNDTERKCGFSLETDTLVLEAQQLKLEALENIHLSEQVFKKAYVAQEEASKIADMANQITLQALRNEIDGQKQLITAGHKFMKAGAKLQKEATLVGKNRAAIISNHKQEEICQKTSIDLPFVQPRSQIFVKREKFREYL